MKNSIFKTGMITCMLLISVQGKTQQEVYKNPKASFDDRATDLLSRLTLEEKVSMMKDGSKKVERLGIETYNWWNEALHGVARAGKATVFPQTIGLAATFDVDGVYETFTMVSDEARAKHHEFKRNGSFRRYEGLTFWTPNINIFRDPRWGRGMETYGEDPYLTTLMGIAVVKGLQGDGTSYYDKTHACAKHYAVHSGPEWNRHSYDAKNISKRDLWETYMPAFEALVKDAGVKEVMCAYNRFEGEPCCSSNELLVHILRNEWGFDDVVVSDCGAIRDFFMKDRHETHADAAEASAAAVIAGTDLNCGSSYDALLEAVKRGLITEEQIDKSVFRLLRARFQLGLFEPDEEVTWAKIPYSIVESKEHVAKALEMAQKSMVLLKNENNILPLNKNMKIAVLGPNAADSVMLWANYNGTPTKSVTILEGIQSKIPTANLVYEKGCDYVENRVFTDKMDRCLYDGKQGFKATFWNTVDFSGQVAATSYVTGALSFDNGGNTVFAPGVNLTNFSGKFESTFYPDKSEEILLRVYADDVCRVYLDGKEVLSARQTSSNAPKEYTFQAQENKPVHILLEYYQEDRNANLRFEIGTAKEMNYQEMAEKVKDVDAIIFVGGISSRIEGEQMKVDLPGFRGGDRTTIEMPDVQVKLLKALKATGKPVVFVLCSGSSMALPWESENLDAILAAWYPGQQGGTAVADVLFGDYNPAGRLPLTFYSSTGELPDYEDYNMNLGRTYRYYKGKPLYDFGYGLSYTTFTYGKPQADKNTLKAGETLRLTIPVTNAGGMDGDEVVQVYMKKEGDPEGPIKALRAFKRVSIPKGKTENVVIELDGKQFEWWNEKTQSMDVQPGNYKLFVGKSSKAEDLTEIAIRLQ